MDMIGGVPTPLNNMSWSIGMMTFPTEWKNTIHVPNHHAEMDDDLGIPLGHPPDVFYVSFA